MRYMLQPIGQVTDTTKSPGGVPHAPPQRPRVVADKVISVADAYDRYERAEERAQEDRVALAAQNMVPATSSC